MVKEINAQVTSEIIETTDGDDKANPIRRLIITKGGNKILPRYLSGPTSSCHDLCKYGIKHAVETKPWSMAKKRAGTRGWKSGVPEETVTSSAWTKKSAASSKPAQTSKTGDSDCPVVIKEVVLSITNEKLLSSEKNIPPSEEIDVSVEHTTCDLKQARSEPSSLPARECSNSQTNGKIVKCKSLFGSSSGKKSESSSKQRGTSLISGKKTSESPSFPLSSTHYVKKSSSISAKTVKNQKGLSHLSNQKNIKEVNSELPSNDNLPEKILHVIEPTPEIKSVEPTMACGTTNFYLASPSFSGPKSLKQAGNQIGKSGLPASSRESLRHSKHGVCPTRLARSPLSSGNKGKRHMQKRMHSTLSSLTSLPTSASTKSPSKSSLGKQNGATSKYNKTGPSCQGEDLKMRFKIRTKTSTISGAGNNAIPARKLTFKRGKVVELQQPQSNIPRRLKFKPARLLTDIPGDKKDLKTGIFRRTEVIDGESNEAKIQSEKVAPRFENVEGSKRRSVRRRLVDGSKIDGSKPGSEQVVLRHQNVEEKKVTQRLYNNVIEETASRLTGLRQSKVKALVGAFETVMCLDSHEEAMPEEISSAC